MTATPSYESIADVEAAAQKMREENAGIPAHKLRAAKRKELQQ